MSQEWYYARSGQRSGPVSSKELRRLAAMGGLGQDDLVWTAGMPEWRRGRSVKGLFPQAGPIVECEHSGETAGAEVKPDQAIQAEPIRQQQPGGIELAAHVGPAPMTDLRAILLGLGVLVVGCFLWGFLVRGACGFLNADGGLIQAIASWGGWGLIALTALGLWLDKTGRLPVDESKAGSREGEKPRSVRLDIGESIGEAGVEKTATGPCVRPRGPEPPVAAASPHAIPRTDEEERRRRQGLSIGVAIVAVPSFLHLYFMFIEHRFGVRMSGTSNSFWGVITSKLYWYWAFCCLILTAAAHVGSMDSKRPWKTLGEVTLRSLVFALLGLIGGFVGMVLTAFLGLGHENQILVYIGFVALSLLAGLLPDDLAILLLVSFGLMQGVNLAMRSGSKHFPCRRCQGTGYCYVCRGVGAIQGAAYVPCLASGRCLECSGTGNDIEKFT